MGEGVKKAKTYDDWLAAGFQVRKGEKATDRCLRTGKPTFTRAQVEESGSFDRGPREPRDSD